MSSTRPSLVRLLRLHQCIAEGRYPSLVTLAEICAVDPRTVKRDLRLLREEFDAPLAYCRGRAGYYYAHPFTPSPVALTEGEELALCMMMTLAGAMRNTHLSARCQAVMRKLQILLPEPIGSALGDEGSFISCLGEALPPERVESAIHFNDLLSALETHRRVRLHYHSMTRNAESIREVDPYHCYFHRGMWYLHGWCHTRQATRDFALERIKAVELLSTSFTPPDMEAIRAKLAQRFSNIQDTLISVAIHFDVEIARRIRERIWHPSQQIDDHPDGSCTLQMTVEGMPSVVNWLLSFGRHARPFSPPELVQLVREEIAAMASMPAL